MTTKLRKLRKMRNISTKELAKMTQIPYRTLLHYEVGDRDINKAKLDTIVDLSLALETDIRDILEDEELICKLTIIFNRL